MASLVNSLRNITSDNWWAVKLIVFAYVPFFILINNDIIFQNNPNNFIILSVFLVLYLGSGSLFMNRNINNKSPIMPNFQSLPEIIYRGIMSVIFALPAYILMFVALSFIKTNIHAEPFVIGTINTIVVLIFIPFMVVPLVLFSVKSRIKDAFNLKNIFESSGNFIVQFLSYLIQYIFSIFLMTFLIYKVITEMLGYGLVLEILVSISAAVTIFSFFSYCSDLYGDVIVEIKEEKKKKRL